MVPPAAPVRRVSRILCRLVSSRAHAIIVVYNIIACLETFPVRARAQALSCRSRRHRDASQRDPLCVTARPSRARVARIVLRR